MEKICGNVFGKIPTAATVAAKAPLGMAVMTNWVARTILADLFDHVDNDNPSPFHDTGSTSLMPVCNTWEL